MLTGKRTRRTALFAFVLLVLMLFPYGPLFPWSPVKPGYDHVALARADIYYPAGTPLDPAYGKIDEYIADSERFHQMKAPSRLCVVACGDWVSFGRYLPQHRSSRGIGAVTLATGTVIFASPDFACDDPSESKFAQRVSVWRSAMACRRHRCVLWAAEGLLYAR